MENDKKKTMLKWTGYAAVTLLLMIMTMALLAILSSLSILPLKLLAIICLFVILFAAFLCVFIWLPKPYKWQQIICWVLVAVLLAGEGIGYSYLLKADSTLSNITTLEEEYVSTAELLVLADSSITSTYELNNKTIGSLEYLDTQAAAAVEEKLSLQNIAFKSKKYTGIPDLVQALYDKKVDAIILNTSYHSLIQEDADFDNFEEETRAILEVPYSTKRTSSTVAVDDITSTPFTILISGSDSRNGLEEIGRTDTNMLVTINPQDNTILLVSIPRDFYVPMACGPGIECPDGESDKLTHTGWYGVETTKKTIEKFFDITINYTVRVNFDAVTSIVDALDGIDVFVEEGLAVDSFRAYKKFSVTEGINHLNGKQALAFARERYAYLDGDRQRIKNQQIVLEAIFEKATSTAMVIQYSKFMDALANSMETDLSQEEIQSLIQFQLNGNPKWTFYTYSVKGDDGMELCASVGSYAYVMIPDTGTVANAKKYIQACLDGNEDILKNMSDDSQSGLEEIEPEETETPAEKDGVEQVENFELYQVTDD